MENVYSLGLAEALLNAGQSALELDPNSPDAQRATLYLALLSCELTLKHLLERANVPIDKIRKLSHRLDELVHEVSACTVDRNVTGSLRRPVRASRVLSLSIGKGDITVGKLLTVEKDKAVAAALASSGLKVSVYPNEIRYGDEVVHVTAEDMLLGAKALIEWARDEGQSIRVS